MGEKERNKRDAWEVLGTYVLMLAIVVGLLTLNVWLMTH
jgi:hypothetical protein